MVNDDVTARKGSSAASRTRNRRDIASPLNIVALPSCVRGGLSSVLHIYYI